MPSMAHPALGTSRSVRCFQHRRTPVKNTVLRIPRSYPPVTPILLFNHYVPSLYSLYSC